MPTAFPSPREGTLRATCLAVSVRAESTHTVANIPAVSMVQLPRTVYAINRSMAFIIALRSSEESDDITASRDSSITARSDEGNLDIA